MNIVKEIEKEFGVNFEKIWKGVFGVTIQLHNNYAITILSGKERLVDCTILTVEIFVTYKDNHVVANHKNIDLKRLKEIVEEVKNINDFMPTESIRMSELEEDK